MRMSPSPPQSTWATSLRSSPGIKMQSSAAYRRSRRKSNNKRLGHLHLGGAQGHRIKQSLPSFLIKTRWSWSRKISENWIRSINQMMRAHNSFHLELNWLEVHGTIPTRTRIQRMGWTLTIVMGLRICQHEGAWSHRIPGTEGFRARIIQLVSVGLSETQRSRESSGSNSRLKGSSARRNSATSSAARAMKISATKRLNAGRI